MNIINPATEELILSLTEDSSDVLTAKFNLLKTHQPHWNSIVLSERVIILNLFADLLRQHVEPLAKILTEEMGKPLQQSRNEINGAAGRVSWLCDHAVKYLSEEVMTLDDHLVEKIVYEPLGVVCNISAWNYPYNVGVNVFVPALLAGNAVLYKPSEYTTLTGLEIEKLLKQAGVPDEVFQTAIGGAEVGKIVLGLPCDGYYFTGSYKTGKYIYEQVALKMVPCQLELGGKDAVYVADDIENIVSAAAGIADGAFYNNGQSCCAVERIYVHQSIYNDFLQEFVQEVKSWKTGSPEDTGTYISVLSRASQLDYLDDQIKDAIIKGAIVLTGGSRSSSKGYAFEPTILSEVNHSMSIMKDESFGPVIGIMKVKDDDEAIALMNDSDYGLTSAVYSKSLQRAQAIFNKVDTGTVYWNCCDRVSAAVPWSGRKHSGIGSTLSHQGLRTFSRPKAYQLKG